MIKDIGFQYGDETYKNKDFVDVCNIIYPHLSDELSKNIFTNRLLYSLTDDSCFMRNVILSTEAGKRMYDACKKGDTYIYGAGRRGRRLKQMFALANWGGVYR